MNAESNHAMEGATADMDGPAPLENLQLLRVIDEGVAGETGEGFFRSLVMAMARALQVVNAFACEFNADRSIALLFAEWNRGALVDDPPPFVIDGTPCQLTLAGDIVAFEDRVGERFPYLHEVGAQSYLAIPLKTNGGEVVGHLAVIDVRPRHWREADFGVLRIFAARAAAEIERRRYERELQRATQRAEQASHAKSQFLAHLSHEIRTPLNAIFGYAQLLARDSSQSVAQSTAVQHITHAGEHLLGLINELLDIAKIEAGTVELELEPINLETCLSHVTAVARLGAEQAGLGFHFEAPEVWPPHLLLDERKLRQIVLNLLNNAVQFTEHGRIDLETRVSRLESDRYRIQIGVRDTGVGLDRDNHARIFEPFFRTDGARRMADGSGLGLAIVQRLVHLMNGTVTVVSEAGRGSLFTVDIIADAAGPGAPSALPVAAHVTGYQGSTRTVLIVDDSPASRDVLRQLLQGLRFRTAEADNGDEALAIARTCAPDLIFMDLVMPGIDGFETVRRLRDAPPTRAVPVVMLSAHAIDDARQLSRDHGCNGFLSKPVRFEQVLETLQTHLKLRWTSAPTPVPRAQNAAAISRGHHVWFGIRSDEVRHLLALAQQGDIVGMGLAVDALGTGPGVAPAFIDTLRELMKCYDMQGIRELLRPMLP